ncbi:MAG: hypothetical protein ACIARR_10860 [Phycisphaerales bacterium JB059]
MGDEKPISRMRGLGRFVGHVWGAISTPADDRETVEVRREVEQERRDGVILRRTTIEEIELPKDSARGVPDGRAAENDA